MTDTMIRVLDDAGVSVTGTWINHDVILAIHHRFF
jgi:hypothetical protein